MAVLACFVCLCLSGVGFAQNIYGTTTLDIDPSSGGAIATCETDLDGETQSYYEAIVHCSVVDSQSNLIASGAYTDTNSAQGYAQVVLRFTAVPGTTYTATGTHSAVIYLGDYAIPEPNQPAQYEYEDVYNFTSLDGSQQTYTNNYDWMGPGPEVQTRRNSLMLGSTTDTRTDPKLTCSPNPVVRGIPITCTASGPSASFSNWQFTDGTNTVTSAAGSTATTWSGIAVTTGTVSVTVTSSDSSQITMNATITVSPRSGWAFTAQPATQVATLVSVPILCLQLRQRKTRIPEKHVP
jgi:hypothetical protein